MTLICPACGRPFDSNNINVANDAAFCPPCGKLFRVSELMAVAAPQPENPPPATETPAPAAVPVPESPAVPLMSPATGGYCAKCGAALAASVKFCARCGTPTETMAGTVSSGYAASGQYQQTQYIPLAGTNKKPWQYFIETFKKYAVFQGRARRAEYWWYALFCGVLGIIVQGLGEPTIVWTDFGPINPLSLIFTLLFLLPSLGVCVRRLHDCGKNGWYMLIPIYNIVLVCTAGDVGPNQYGPDPKADN